jgi:hypothetical protein
MSDGLELKKYVGTFLKNNGFKKNGQRWMLASGDCILVFHFDKSRNSNSHYLRVGFWLSGMEQLPATLPHPGGFHISCEFRELVPGADNLELQFEFGEQTGYQVAIEERLAVCNTICDGLIKRLAEGWSTQEAIKAHYFLGDLKAARINYQVRDYFGDLEWRKTSKLPDGNITIILPDDI